MVYDAVIPKTTPFRDVGDASLRFLEDKQDLRASSQSCLDIAFRCKTCFRMQLIPCHLAPRRLHEIRQGWLLLLLVLVGLFTEPGLQPLLKEEQSLPVVASEVVSSNKTSSPV